MAEITVSVPNSTFTITKPATGFTVTTPSQQVLEVNEESSTIEVTNAPINITVAQVGVTNTDQLIEGTNNLFFTEERAQAAAAGLFTAGTGVNINEGEISIGQSVATTANPTFNSIKLSAGSGSLKRSDGSVLLTYTSGTGPDNTPYKDVNFGGAGISPSYVNVDNRILFNSAELTTTTTASGQLLDKFSSTAYRAANYLIHISANGDYQMWEGMIIHNGTNAYLNAYGDLRTSSENLALITVAIVSGMVEIRATPVYASTTFKIQKTLMNV